MTPWSETEVVVTGLDGGVGALVAKQLLLRGVKKVWLHHPTLEDVIDESHLETSCGILRANDLGDGVASAFARRLRGYGVCETLGVSDHLDVNTVPRNALVCVCDGSGELANAAGLGEQCRNTKRAFAFVKARGLTGTVFVDSGTPDAVTLYQALRPQNTYTTGGAAENTTDSFADTQRTDALHAAFLLSNPETRWLLAKKDKNVHDVHALIGATLTGHSPGPFAALVAEIACEGIGDMLRMGRVAPDDRPDEVDDKKTASQWTHVDALDVLDSGAAASAPVPKSETCWYEPIPCSGNEETSASASGDNESGGRISRPTLRTLIGHLVMSKLAKGKVLLAGVGTPGGGAALEALCALGVGEIVLVDDESVSSGVDTGVDPNDTGIREHPILRLADPGDLACVSVARVCARVAANAFPDVRVETCLVENMGRFFFANENQENRLIAAVDASSGHRAAFRETGSCKLVRATGAAAAMELALLAKGLE